MSTMTQSASSTPSRPDQEERQEWLSLASGAVTPRVDLITVHEMVALVVESAPDAVAVRSGSQDVTYHDLYSWSGRVTALLAKAGVGVGDRVAVLLDSSAALVAAALGVLRAGAAYVAPDLSQPVADVLEDAEVAAVLVSAATEALAPAGDVPVLVLADTFAAEGAAGGTDDRVPTWSLTADDPALLSYMRGSRGEPEGVVIGHGNLAASTLARHLLFPNESTFLLVSPLSDDSSAAGLWGTLEAGNRLVIPTAEERADADRLLDLIAREQVSRLRSTLALYDSLLAAAERGGADRLDSLRMVTVADAPLTETLVKRHFAAYSRPVSLISEYGPVETTVWAAFHRLNAPGPVALGRPIPGVRLYVLDEERRPVATGGTGELFIAGPTVALGYYNNQSATDGWFFDDPFADEPGGRMYRTGDLVRWNDSGDLEFVGGGDRTGKMYGHRVSRSDTQLS
ncbi:AMP-binding protein [Streptomyces sp. NPDC058459]|uniref:AMP-binding protein n=1 Tax=Streptomyces sp. NPDC058459 TaxID=3346508 RepID=UPI0036502C21